MFCLLCRCPESHQHLLYVWETWTILFNKRLLVDIFLTRNLSRSLAFREVAGVDFEPSITTAITIIIAIVIVIAIAVITAIIVFTICLDSFLYVPLQVLTAACTRSFAAKTTSAFPNGKSVTVWLIVVTGLMNGRALQSRLVVTPPSSNALTGSVFLMGLFVIVKMTAVMRRMRNIVVSLSQRPNIGRAQEDQFYVHNFKEKQKK